MDVREFEDRVASGLSVDLDMGEVQAANRAVLINLDKRPFTKTLGLMAKVIKQEEYEGSLPVYLRFGLLDIEEENLGVDAEVDEIVHVGYLKLTLDTWRRLENAVYSYNPIFCNWDNGQVAKLKREDYAHTIELKGEGSRNGFI